MIGYLCVLNGSWLNETFHAFDSTLLEWGRQLHLAAGSFFDTFFRIITSLADDGIAMIVLAVMMLLFCKTRRCGVSSIIALLIGLLVTNIILKNVIVRSRPYDADPMYMQWFTEVFGAKLSDNSFPSGHTTATFAVMTPIFICFKKRYSFVALIFGLLMAISRVYLVVHYPTDVIVGMIIGVAAGVIGYYSAKGLYRLLDKYDNRFTYAMRSEDILTVYKRIVAKYRISIPLEPPSVCDEDVSNEPINTDINDSE